MNNQAITRALIDLLCFLEFTGDELLAPDVAVSQMEQVAATLRSGGDLAVHAFCQACEEYASAIERTNAERSEFLRSLPEAMGLV